MARKYIIYDGRGKDGEVMEVCDTLAEAQKNKKSYGTDCKIYSYEVKGKELIDEKAE